MVVCSHFDIDVTDVFCYLCSELCAVDWAINSSIVRAIYRACWDVNKEVYS